MSATESGFLQTVAGLRPNTTYRVSAQLKREPSDDRVYVGVKDYGGLERKAFLGTSTSYIRRSLSFTTGPASTSAVVYIWRTGTGVAYGDEVPVEPVPVP